MTNDLTVFLDKLNERSKQFATISEKAADNGDMVLATCYMYIATQIQDMIKAEMKLHPQLEARWN